MSTLHTTLAAIVQDMVSWLRWHRPRSRYARLLAEIERLDGVVLEVAGIAASALGTAEGTRRAVFGEARPQLTLHRGGAA